MKRVVFIFLLLTCWTVYGNAQQKDSIKIQRPMTLVPESFFNWDDYELSSNYDSVCTPSRWVSLYGEYLHTKAMSGIRRGGTTIEFGRDNRFWIVLRDGRIGPPCCLTNSGNEPCGDYRLDTANGLLYMRWNKKDTIQAKDSFYYNGIVCKIEYYRPKSTKLKEKQEWAYYDEALYLSRYAGATWDMPVKEIKECRAVFDFGVLVRGIVYKGKSFKTDFP